MYEGIAYLIKEVSYSYDEYLNEIVETKKREVFVQPLSIYSSEFYQAAQAGIHPSITLELANREDYEGEKFVSYNGIIYHVVRVDWTGQKDKIRLILEERIGDESE